MISRDLTELPTEPVSHNPEILKQVFLRNGELGPLTQIAQAVFQPGDVAPGHAHQDMAEAFLVLDGTLTITVDGTRSTHGAGSFLALRPGEWHELSNQGDTPLTILTIGARMEP